MAIPTYAPGWPRPAGVAQVKEGVPFSFSSVNTPDNNSVVLPKPSNTDFFPKGKDTDFFFIWGITATTTHASNQFIGSFYGGREDDPSAAIEGYNFLLFGATKADSFDLILPQPIQLKQNESLKIEITGASGGVDLLTVYYTVQPVIL